jgi:hypothetical protein
VATGGTDPQATTAPDSTASSPPVYCGYATGPVVLDRPAQQATLIATSGCFTASSGSTTALYSPDGGLHWPQSAIGYVEGGYGAGYSLHAIQLGLLGMEVARARGWLP